MLDANLRNPVVFVRPYYDVMFVKMFQELDSEEFFRGCVSGNPGIGKSMFYVY